MENAKNISDAMSRLSDSIAKLAPSFAALNESFKKIAGMLIESFGRLQAFRIPGFILVRCRVESEFLAWGMPEMLTKQLLQILPYSSIVLLCKIIRR